MRELLPLCLFSMDVLVALATAWLLVRAAAGTGVLERLLGWSLALLVMVAASGEILGWFGAMGPRGFFLAHVAVLLVLARWRRTMLRGDAQALRQLGLDVVGQFRAGGWPAIFGGLLVAAMVGQVVLAALGKPVVYDALTYRFSRIALWLQEGCIVHFATDDPRLNYMPVAPDLVMAWLLGAHATGYQWAALAQTIGGGLFLGATAGLARLTGLGRGAALGTAGLTLGMANVVPQFTSAYTDLFAAGVFAATFYLWLAALRRGEGSCLGGAGTALALGAKGTLLYLAPGALLWVVWLGWRHRAPWRTWRRTVWAAGLAGLLLVAPGWVRNARAYGGWFGPADYVRLHHGAGFSPGDRLRKLWLNLETTFGQLLEPNAQPPWWGGISRRAGLAWARRLPVTDAFAFDELNRRANLEKVLHLPEPDADVASCGVLAVVTFALGTVTALVLRRRRPGADLVLLWGAGVIGFVLCLYTLLQWHPYSFRFWLLVAPWMAVVTAWWLEMLPRLARLWGWGFIALCTGTVFFNDTVHTYQAGWAAVAHAERGLSFTVFSQIRAWLPVLDPSDATLQVALPVNQPLAAFLRLDNARPVKLRRLSELPPTAEAAVQDLDGWLVVPARHFSGHEGRVDRRLWFFYGDRDSPFSLAAYRRLPPGD